MKRHKAMVVGPGGVILRFYGALMPKFVSAFVALPVLVLLCRGIPMIIGGNNTSNDVRMCTTYQIGHAAADGQHCERGQQH